MKLFVGIILTIALVVIAYFTFKTNRQKHSLSRTVRRILLIGFFSVLFNIISLFTEYDRVSLFAYCAYFTATDWLLYYLLHFSIEYVGGDFEKYVEKNLMKLVLLLDSFSLWFNNIYGHMFEIKRTAFPNGETAYEMMTKPLFYAHYFIVLMLVIFCLISLFYGAFKAPIFYRRKYLMIAVNLVVIVIVNICTFNDVIDYSVIGYVVEAVCIYYCAFVYTPQRLLPETLFRVAADMQVAIFVMDIEGRRLYHNKFAQKWLEGETMPVDENGITLENWCREKYMNFLGDMVQERVFYLGENELTLKIHMQRMRDVNRQLQGGYFVVQDRTEEIKKIQQKHYQASHDKLTGLYNREYFYIQSKKYIRKNSNSELLMICTDIKDFKMINDFFGTKIGDEVLVNFARILEERIQNVIVCGRLGNDVFGLLMKKDDFEEEVFDGVIQEAFSCCTDESMSFPAVNYVGVYEITDRDIPVSVMCDRARMAIHSIKGNYQKHVAYYDEGLREKVLHEQELIAELDAAIKGEQFQMYLQPQMSCEGKLLGAEALVRWQHPVKGMIMPGEFIPIFEKNGLISEVDKYIWELACRQLHKWKEEGREDIYLSVNISPRDFYFLNIYQIFTDLVAKYDIEPRMIKLEITETAVVMDLNRQLELISRLRQSGFVVEMDDFGSGYSSLNMLKDIHVDVLKIDMAFLKKARDEERSRKILRMMISLSKQLDMPVITEGVETAEQVEFLTEMGCDMFQGYFFAKPMPVEEFENTYFTTNFVQNDVQ